MDILESGRNKYREAKRIIREARSNGQLVLFVGAGVSAPSGMPLWDEAVSQIESKLDKTNSKEEYNNLLVPQYYYNNRGGKEYTQLMREVFHYNDNLQTNDIHEVIIQFDVETIITTNYDHLIEQAAEKRGQFLNVVSQDYDLPYRKAGKELIKMHGDFEHDNFVLKEDDYLHYHKNFKLIENYIKSIIGTKTVLFIGYSLYDPDVKHVFSWVKEILDNHFQRAYLIVTGRDKDVNEDEYYRRLGVNTIYATDLFSEKIIAKDDHTNQLLHTLRYLLDDKDEGLIPVNTLYEQLLPYSKLNYLYKRYIQSILFRIKNSSLDEFKPIIDKDDYLAFIDNTTEKEQSFIDDVCLYFDGKSKNKQIQLIMDTLKRSAIQGVSWHDNNGKLIKIEFPDIDEEVDWIEPIEYFDYRKILEAKDSYTKLLSESNPELYLRQAYICSFLGDYLTSYYCLNNAAVYFYRRKEYVWYFIASWNKRNVANMILQGMTDYQIDDSIMALIRQDYERIDLNKTLQSIPNLGNDNNQFLRDLIDFKFASDLFYDVFNKSNKANVQAKSSYYLFAGVPAYEQMRQQVYEYYRYSVFNYLLVDRYNQNTEIYNLFVQVLFASVSAPDIDITDKSSIRKVTNVHATSVSYMDVHLIIRYIGFKRLKELFREFSISVIDVDDEAIAYLIRVAKNIQDLISYNTRLSHMTLCSYLCFVSHIKINDELAELVINAVAKREIAVFDTDYIACLIDFIDSMYSQNLYDNKQICVVMEKWVKKLIVQNSNNNTLPKINRLINEVLYFLSKGGHRFNDETIVNALLKDENYALIIPVFKNGSHSVRRIISDQLSKWQCSDNATGYMAYVDFVLLNIISPQKEIEDKAIDFIDENNKRKRQEKEKGIISASENDNVARCFLELVLSNNAIDGERLKDVLSMTGDGFIIWLLDVDNFDYSQFEMSWLKLCRPRLLEELSTNSRIRERIINLFKERYSVEHIEKEIIEILIRFFLQ